MTREEIIKGLENYIPWADEYEVDIEVLTGALALLKQEPCGDLISRQAVLDGIEELKKSPWATDRRGNGFEYLIAEALDVVADLCVKQASSVNPQEPKTGHWEWVQYDYNPKLGNWHCSECRCIVVECVDKEEKGGIPLYKYCPQCGCRMFEPQESEVQE